MPRMSYVLLPCPQMFDHLQKSSTGTVFQIDLQASIDIASSILVIDHMQFIKFEPESKIHNIKDNTFRGGVSTQSSTFDQIVMHNMQAMAQCTLPKK